MMKRFAIRIPATAGSKMRLQMLPGRERFHRAAKGE